MSRGNNTDQKNPATKFFKWRGSDGSVVHYDKETKENVEMQMPFMFLVLDRLTTLTGYSDQDSSGIWANEIRNTKTEVLTVRTKAGIKSKGLYEQVKNTPGAKYAQSLYIAFFDENKQLVIGNFKISGAAVSGWIDYSKANDVYRGVVVLADKEKDKKGATTFFKPVFKFNPKVSPETEAKAIELDNELQSYLKSYFALAGEQAAEADAPEEDYRAARDRELNEYTGGETADLNSPADYTEKVKTAAAGKASHVQPDPDEIPF